MSAMSQDSNAEGDDRAAVLFWTAVAAFVLAIGFALAFLPLGDWVTRFSEWIGGLGALGILAFCAAYIVMMLLLVPASPISIAAGVAYGWWALPLVTVVATVGAYIAFLIGRYIAGAKVDRIIRRRPAMKAATEAVEEEPWTTLALLRLSPLVPFNVQNYLLGITEVSTRTYLISTFAGILPGAALNVYLGVVGKAVTQGEAGPVEWISLGLGLAATVAVTVLVSRRARAKLAEKGIGR